MEAIRTEARPTAVILRAETLTAKFPPAEDPIAVRRAAGLARAGFARRR